MPQPTAEDFLGGTRVKSAQFGKRQKGASPVPGTVEHGLIVEEPTTMQRRKYNPGKLDDGTPLFWDEEKTQPQWQLVVKLQTDQRDDNDDDGVRAVYVFGQLKAATVDALKKAGAKKLAVGGHLYVKFVEQIINDAGFKQNMFACKYEPPAAQVDFWPEEPAMPVANQARTQTGATLGDAENFNYGAGTSAVAPAGQETMLERLKRQGQAGADRITESRAQRADFDDEPPF